MTLIIPHTFEAGKKALAQEVNENFGYLKSALETTREDILAKKEETQNLIYSTKTALQAEITTLKEQTTSNLEQKANLALENSTPAIDFAKDKLAPAGIHTVIKTYQNGNSWYRVYSDGWCEQGGLSPDTDSSSHPVDLIIPYANANYSVVVTSSSDRQTQGSYGFYHSRSTTRFYVVSKIGYADRGAMWVTYGQVNLEELENEL